MKRFWSILLVCALLLGTLALGESAPLEEENLPDSDILETVEEDGDEGIPEPLEDGEEPEEAPEDGEEPEDPDALPDEEELEEEIVDSRVLQYGDEGDDVLMLQTRLADLKYYTGNLSGRYREGTREAVRSFQAEYGLEKTGVADLETQNRLFSAKYRTLRYGAKGDEVLALQNRLKALGYYEGKVSGNFLGGTQKSIREFQQENGLTVTGAADPLTLEALYSQKAKRAGGAESAGADSAYLVDDGEGAESASAEAEALEPFTKTLKSGSSGALVKQLQQRMTDLGYYTGPVSGNYAKQTTRAVKTIQVQNGLKDTGKVDEETWNVIFNDSGIVMPEATPKPTPTPEPVPYAMTVDVTNQVTTVYALDEKGEYTVPVRYMLCSTGTKANPSSVGDWVLNGRHAKWCVFPKWGNSYARYWTRINSDIAFHSVIYTAVDLNAMKTSSYKALGTRASHGCIRLTVADAKWVYENIGAGTVVSIREDLPSDPELRHAMQLPPLKKGTSIPVETPVPTAEPEYNATKEPELGNRKLRKKSEGPEVYWVQTRLKELGYYTGYVGGIMLDGTVKAVKSFQKAQGIYASGEVDQKTLDLMVAPPEITETVELDTTVVPAEVNAPTPTPGPENA